MASTHVYTFAMAVAAVEASKKWVDVAHTLGVRSVSCGPGKVDPKNLVHTAESYRSLAAYALLKGVRVVVENQVDFGADAPEDMVRLFKLVGPGGMRAVPSDRRQRIPAAWHPQPIRPAQPSFCDWSDVPPWSGS